MREKRNVAKMMNNNNTKLMICALGIFVCYFYFGMLQEKITRGQYGEGEHKEKFTYMFALVFIQCLINYSFAKCILLATLKEEDTTRTIYYVTSSLTYFLAMVCSFMALQFVSYPTQVVGKAGKPIPVMILGVLLGKKVYPMRKYFFVFLIVSGVIMFMYKDGKAANKQAEGSQMGFGELLILLSLTMDGLTSAVQERMRAEHKSKSGHMMVNMNFWTIIFSGIVIIISGELVNFVGFLERHPSVIWHIVSFSIAGALGQFFIFKTVADFGPLPCSIITTTRKFFTVLGSVLLFGNNLIARQWLATFIVFSGLLLDAIYGKPAADKSAKKETIK